MCSSDLQIVLRVALDDRENQDVAVFTVEQFNDGTVAIQLIGDEDLYGRNYIIEPIYDDMAGETPNPGYTGRAAGGQRVQVVRTSYVEVAAWPLIRFIYTPGYIAWRSAWYWGYWPAYWHAWRPFYWHYYYGYHAHWYPHYYSHFRLWHRPRIAHYHHHYYNQIRVHSPLVRSYINEGRYRSTYSRPELRSRGEALYAQLHQGERGTRQENGLNQGRSRGEERTSARERATSVDGRGTSATTARNRSTTLNGNRGTSATTARNRAATEGGNRAATKSAVRNQENQATQRQGSGATQRQVTSRQGNPSVQRQGTQATQRQGSTVSPPAGGTPQIGRASCRERV